MKDGADHTRMLGFRGVLLPIVEQIDPALVPELFWRVVATRPSTGNPRSVGRLSSSALVMLLAWYDRNVAATLFEPIRTEMEHTGDHELASGGLDFLAWSIFDPRRGGPARTSARQSEVRPQCGLYQTTGCRNTWTLSRGTLAIYLAQLQRYGRTFTP